MKLVENNDRSFRNEIKNCMMFYRCVNERKIQ